jgi:hypothetical protein
MEEQEKSQSKREYNAKNIEKRRKYYEDNRYRICNHTLNVYCIKAIEGIRTSCLDTVNDYMKCYPFEEYAEHFIKRELNKNNIYPSQGKYADCYDAGMLAYLYSIHRCAAMRYSHTEAYIKKMIRIYIICALVIYDDTKNLCRANGFREIQLDAETSINRY